MDPGEQLAAYDWWHPGKSSLEEMFGLVDNYFAPAPMETVQLLDELHSEYKVVAFGPPQRPISKNLVQGWIKEMVVEQKLAPVHLALQVYRWRGDRKVDHARDHECGQCFAFGYCPIQCTGVW